MCVVLQSARWSATRKETTHMNKLIAFIGGLADIILFVYDELFGNKTLSSLAAIPNDDI